MSVKAVHGLQYGLPITYADITPHDRITGCDAREVTATVSHVADHPPVTMELGPPTRVALPRGSPMRLIFRGLSGTADPVFRADGLDLVIGGRPVPTGSTSADVVLAGVASDPTEIAIPPGRYRVVATRGPEFDLTEATLDVAAGTKAALEIEAPKRVVEAPGWVSADLQGV